MGRTCPRKAHDEAGGVFECANTAAALRCRARFAFLRCPKRKLQFLPAVTQDGRSEKLRAFRARVHEGTGLNCPVNQGKRTAGNYGTRINAAKRANLSKNYVSKKKELREMLAPA